MPTPAANVLIVDDTPENLRVLEGFLSVEGHRVRSAPSGKLALASAARDVPDLMLLDINMPEMDGLDVCRRFKADPMLREVPILFLSAYTDIEHKVQALEAGGADYVSKPFQWQEVRARVNTQLVLRQARRELESRNADLSRALSDLRSTQVQLVEREKMASLGILTAGIAHEINNPVNFIVGGLAGLRKLNAEVHSLLAAYSALTPGDAAALRAAHERRDAMDLPEVLSGQDELVGSIEVGAQRAAEIVKGLRIFAGKDEAVAKPISISDNLNSALMILSSRLKRIEVVRAFSFIGSVVAHPGQLNQLFINLMSNAADAVDAAHPDGGGRIVLGLHTIDRAGRKHVVVEVGDNGTGLAPEVQARMFEPFFTTKPVGQGTGLGLAIVQGIVKAHQALLEVESKRGEGTLFRLLLPLEPEAGHG